MQPDTSPIAGNEKGMRLGFLVRQFHRAVERQRARDAEWIATFERVARDPHIRGMIKQVCQEVER
jgi:hypothetical protein